MSIGPRSRTIRLIFLVGGATAGLQAQSTTAAPADADPPPTWLAPGVAMQNDLPPWLQIAAQFRSRLEESGHIKFGPDNDTHNLTQFRLRLTIRPTDWLAFVGETQDARVFFNHEIEAVPPYENTFDVRQAYVELGSQSLWWDARVGRQNLSFGDERLIGPSDWLNQGRTFDAIRFDLHHRWFALALFSSSVVVSRDGVVDHHLEGNNLHGTYGSLKQLIPGMTLEPYVLWRVAPGNVRLAENDGRGGLSEVTVGAMAEGNAGHAFRYDMEMDRQSGRLGPDSIDAWAGHWNISKMLPGPGRVRPFFEVNYASGTKDPSSGQWGTFDQLYPSSHNKLGFADQVGFRNIEQYRAGVSERSGRRWRFNETYADFWLARARDALYASSGAVVAQAEAGNAGRHVGREVDAWVEWTWKRIMEIGVGYARFLTGAFLDRTTPARDYNYPFVSFTYHLTQERND